MTGTRSRKSPAETAGAKDAEPGYWVYILRCADGSFYTGIARDLARRTAEHNGERGRGARYTAARRPVQVVYRSGFPDRSTAQQEEARIKGLSRIEKARLVGAFSGGRER